MSRRLSVAALAGALAMVSLGSAAAQEPAAQGTPDSAAEAAAAADLRKGFGFAADAATVARAAADRTAYPVTKWGAPLSAAEGAEVARRIRVQVSLDAAIAHAQRDPGWAGIWVDQDAGGIPVFQFTNSVPGRNGDLASRLPVPSGLRVEQVERSLTELQAQKEVVLAERDELLALGVDVTAVGFDVIHNRISVAVAGPAGPAESLLTARYGTPLTVRSRPASELDACPNSNCLPLKGGLEIVGTGDPWRPTIGFLARRTDTNPDKLVVITAGHAVLGGSSLTVPWTHPPSGTFGFGLRSAARPGEWIHTWFNLSDADVGAIGVGNSYVPPATQRNRMIVDESPLTILSITQTRNRVSQAVNTFVCRMGRTTGRECGFIIDNDETKSSPAPGFGTVLIEHTVVYGRDADGGDSGGPTFVDVEEPGMTPYVVLYGTHVHSQDGYVASGGIAWYSAVDDAVRQLALRHAPFAIVPCTTQSCGLP